ncbi:hypothetical protein [Yersinia pseudotuberculosis]|uniref:hypothetical protein n=1 Tax=Yersinia pseudotuberculosis TaxID=633 RepID=UPI0005EA06DB|nr:hypothetical protein [Yersinia pseudotuberculosis]AYX11962.1 hypothetical protein EGX52_14980 [Yersinia pseudotuberculosis]MBO1567051.1 hypothetical protein [Yersinia pseudotuberculosis]MBO1603910.1 hypothetical protein [Yersinia pseudotuberculosis]CNE32863.1 Uncharacterised protein [Yersinia pseudotuberculosis]CNJ09345.1 Uncharacterised protein [Yersinia pseudotuberculosis]
MRKLIVLSLSTIALIIPSISSAMDIYGEIHPERYTFFLNDKGGDDLKDLNNKMISAIGEVHPGNMQDALNINNLQKEGYDSTGLAPFIPDSIQKSTIRDDGKAVKILTCLVSTVTVPNSTRTVTMDRTWCKDEVGAEYIGFKGWPLRSAIAKSCRVGDNDCPVYLTLQGDDPTVRDDSVKFVSVHPPKVQTEPVITTKKPDPAIIADLKMNGCKIINKYRNLGPDCDSVIDVSGGGVPSDSPVTVYYIDYKKNVDMGRGSASLTYRDSGKMLIKFRDRDDFDGVVDIENPSNNIPEMTEKKEGAWKITRNASAMLFSTINESGTQLELACGENGAFAVRYGTDDHWTTSGPMSQLTLKVGSKEFNPDQTFFESLTTLPAGSKITVLQMGHEYGTFSSHGLAELLKGISYRQCLNPQSGI